MRPILAGGRPTGVVEEGRNGEEFQIHFFQTVKGAEFLEEMNGPVGHVLHVLGLAFVVFHQLPCFPNET